MFFTSVILKCGLLEMTDKHCNEFNKTQGKIDMLWHQSYQEVFIGLNCEWESLLYLKFPSNNRIFP